MDLSPITWPKSVSIVIPSYKSAASLARFLPSVLAIAPSSRILVIDDASGDETPKVCSGLDIRCISHDINKGKGAALRTGFDRALEDGSEWIITMDADGQHAPQDLERFIEQSQRTPDDGLIIGARAIKLGSMPPARILSNTLTSAILSRFCGQSILDSQCGYRAYSARMLRAVTLTRNRFDMESEVILKACHAGFRVSFISVQTLYCSERSHISHLRDTVRWVRTVVAIQRELKHIRYPSEKNSTPA